MSRVALISFYDRICLSTRALSAGLKRHGHESYLLFLKDDRIAVIDSFKKDNKVYQNVFNNKFTGSNEDINPVTEKELDILSAKILEIRPKVIGISARTVSLELAKKVVRTLRKVYPDAAYIGGGYGPTIMPLQFLEFLDFVCLGEGDQSILNMIDNQKAKSAPNVAWQEDGLLRFNPLAKPLKLDNLPYPDWEPENKFLIDDNAIRPINERFDPKTYDIFASRGCPANCSYCLSSQWDRMYRAFDGKMPKIRLRSPQSVIEELLYAIDKYEIDFVRFKDSIFGFNKKWLFEFMNLYDRNIKLKFNCLLDERFTDEESVKRLAASGLDYTIVGIQSTNENIRFEIMQRKITDEGIIAYAEMLVRNGIKIKYDIIGWNPFETNETMSAGVPFLKKLPKTNEIFVFQLSIFPGSPIYEKYNKYRPRPMRHEDYEYWAWICQLILRSKKGEELSELALEDDYYRKNLRALRKLVDQAINENDKRVYAVAARDISARQVITNIMITWNEYDVPQVNGLAFDDKSVVLNKVACRDIPTGMVIRYNDVFGAYENIGVGKY